MINFTHFMRRLLTQWLPNIVLVTTALLLVRFDLGILAFGLILLSKWQIVLGGRRLWTSSIRYNACDLVVAASAVSLFLIFHNDFLIQALVAFLYTIWLIAIKPRSGPVWMAVQAGTCQFSGLLVLFLYGRVLALPILLMGSWLIALIAADHFLAAHTESARPLLVFAWGLIVVQIAWILSRWLIVYPLFGGTAPLPQAPLIISIVGYVFANMYIDHLHKRLQKLRLLEYVALCFGLLILIIVGTKWDTRL